jgi:hypothetical protein
MAEYAAQEMDGPYHAGKKDSFEKKYSIPAGRFCRDPYRKTHLGRIGQHMGIFAGLTGTRLHGLTLREDLRIPAGRNWP